jgi:hypothetical protein
MTTPTIEELEEWHNEGVCEATDGCIVEPDGICEHGCKSWLLQREQDREVQRQEVRNDGDMET